MSPQESDWSVMDPSYTNRMSCAVLWSDTGAPSAHTGTVRGPDPDEAAFLEAELEAGTDELAVPQDDRRGARRVFRRFLSRRA